VIIARRPKDTKGGIGKFIAVIFSTRPEETKSGIGS
jgi:hypothetical protein